MHFTKKQKGAVSVFLTLVLVPVMIFGCLTVDASKIYSAKVVVSDAGEMAMNAALAQYEEKLFDQYGLMAMASTPESINGDLESYFVKTLNSSGISGASSYEEMLGLIEESFEAISVSNTEIYRTEVEKQQILEYMKYRAPVCLTELVLEKLGFIKDTQKLLDAMNKEMEFAKAMEDCQDAFEDALEAVDALNTTIESFPSPQDINDELGHTQIDLTTTVARCLLMRAAIQDYTDKPNNKTMNEMIQSYIIAADKVDLNNPYSQYSYENYLNATYYFNGITANGGVNSLNNDSEAPDEEEDPEGYAQWQANNQANSELISDYNRAKNRISGYMTTLLNCANSYVSTHHDTLNGYYTKAGTAVSQAQTAYNKLEIVREKLNQAATEYNDWDRATSGLSEELRGNMDEQVEEYRSFFGEGENNPLEALTLLETNISIDKDYFSEIKSVLEEEKLFDEKIVTTSTSSQMNTYRSKSDVVVSGQDKSYAELETIRQESFVSHYSHTSNETNNILYRIYDDPFYLKLQEYCEQQETAESESKAEKGNQDLDKGAEGAEEAKDESGFPTYDWSGSSQPLPSVVQGLASYTQASETLTGLNTGNNIKNKSSRRNAINKMQDSINEAQSFLDGVDRIIENNLENLYIAEYGMQMFSYYTCDKKMQSDLSLKTLTDDENISLSGYKLSQDKAYKAEVEYLLWGNSSSTKNIASTVALLYGVRLLFNSIYAFTSELINWETTTAATAIAAGAPYLVPIITIALKFGMAAVETGIDIGRLKDGYGVVILKDNSTFETPGGSDYIFGADVRGSAENSVTFDYGEYLRVFLNVKMMAGMEEKVLARIGDCVQVNTETDIIKDYTMVEVAANVGVKTTFLRRIANWSSADWQYGDSYTVNYKSILGY